MTAKEAAAEATAEQGGLDGRVVTAVLIVLVGAGAWLRLAGLAATALYGDEYHGAIVANNDYGTILGTYDAHGTHVVLPLIQRFVASLFEPGLLTFRVPAAIAGVLTLAIFHPIASRLVGRGAALVATAALAFSPMHVYYSRFGRAYSITILLGLVLVWLVYRADQRRWRGAGRIAAVIAVAALLPWTHLSSLGLVLGIGVAGMGLGWNHEASARGAVRPLLAFAGAAVICLVLFLPIADQVLKYANRMPHLRHDRPEGVLGIAMVLAGGGVAGVVWMVGLPIAFALFYRRRREVAVLLGASILGPLLFLVLTVPHGMEYAYARYLVNGLPGMVMLLSWLLVRGIAGFGGERAAVAAGLALVALGYLTGPLSPRRPEGGIFSNTYLALRPLPAFDERPDWMPAIYETIAEDPKVELIIEAPILQTRTVLLYRNYFMQHGKDVVIGLMTPGDVRLNGPYVYIGQPALGRRTGAQYLIVHKDPAVELVKYWDFVYEEAWPRFENVWDAGLMTRHESYFLPTQDPVPYIEAMLPPLATQLGEPDYEDELVIAWRLRPGRAKGRGDDESRGGDPAEE